MKRQGIHLWVALLCWATVSFTVQADAPASIPASDFVKRSPFGIPSLSPNGEYLAVSVHDPNDAEDGSRYEVGVFHLPDMKAVSRLDMPAKTLPMLIAWTSNTRLIVVPGKVFGNLDAPQLTGSLFAVDYDGSHQRNMYDLPAHGHGLPVGGGIFSGLPPQPNGHFYWTISTNRSDKSSEGVSSLYDVDAETGEAVSIGTLNEDGMQFFASNGFARLAFGINDRNRDMLFERDGKDEPWRKIHVPARSAIPMQISDDGNHVYWKYSADGGPYALAISNFDFSDLKILATDPFGSVSDVLWTPYPRKPFAAIINAGKPKVLYLDDDNSATIHKALSQQFPDLLIRFAGMSDDGSRVLIKADSDRDPGLYALFTLNPVSFNPLFKIASQIDPARMAPRMPIRFTASDGLPLEGYLTIPPRGSKLPLVLLPHGGPIGVRDNWDYDAWAQFLANRGYAVLQVNYRGSAGRGLNFQTAGLRQFGTGIVQDLLDGVHWAIAQGYADKDRVCVVGGSYGGYAALMAPIRAPGMFKCSIDYAGISDLAIQFDDSDTQRTERGRNFLKRAIGTDDDATIKTLSPLYHLDQFNVPVLIVHGEKDPRVPLKNATELRDALDKSGKPYEWLVKPKELHGFYSDADNTDFFEHMQAFLAKYMGT